LAAFPIAASEESPAFIKGADVSFLQQIEDLGGYYMDHGIPGDALKIMQDRGINCIRLRIWHTPAEGYCDLNKTLIMARRIKDRNLGFLLDFHYSDTWADPGHQTKPAAWKNLPFSALKDSVEAYTRKVMAALYAQKTLPDMVQLGNEIVAGMLWNDGRVGGNYDTAQQWQNLADLLRAGIAGVRSSCPKGDSVRIIIHIDRGGDNTRSRWYYDKLISYNVPFDIIGLSYYPWWHGTLDQVKANLNDLALRYDKDIIIAETAYPWTLQWYDQIGNIVGSSSQLLTGYPASVDGQTQFLGDLLQIIGQVSNGRGAGLFYWEPEYISVPPLGSPWENNTLFDFQGNVQSSMDVFKPPVVPPAPVQVTLRLNTSTLMDTLQAWHMTQIRGELNGAAAGQLPDGRQVHWDEKSELWMENRGGDYWQIRIPMNPGDYLAYKFWSGFSPTQPTFQRLGWEGPVVISEASSINQRFFVAGGQDTVLELEYYNSTGDAKLQYWRPFVHKNDSIGVYFRVNMIKQTLAGRFNPDVDAPVRVAGSYADAKFFDTTLNREIYSVAGGSFWSGVSYFARSGLQSGDTLSYRFYFRGAGAKVCSNELTMRAGEADTTLHWVFFIEDPTAAVTERKEAEVSEFRLAQNHPNPFNGSTRIEYNLSRSQSISLAVYDLSGRLLTVLLRAVQPAGHHQLVWRPENQLASGVYLLRLQSGSTVISRKMLYLR